MRIFATIVFGVVIVSCSDPWAPERGSEPLQSDSTVYLARYQGGEGGHARYGFTVVTRFTNDKESTVYLDRCFPETPYPTFGVPIVEPRTRISAYDGAWGCVGHDHHIAVPPGSTRIDTLMISGPGFVQNGRARGTFEGIFRVTFRAQHCASEPCSTPSSTVESNEFRVYRE